jgi:hypothetical protein
MATALLVALADLLLHVSELLCIAEATAQTDLKLTTAVVAAEQRARTV